MFTYRYDVSGYQIPGISHFIISLSEGCSLDPNCITNGSKAVFGVYSGTDQGNSNAGFPSGASIDGVKFGFGSPDSTTYTFTSDRAPVYGDFFLKGGNGPFVYDAGLANPGNSDLRPECFHRPAGYHGPDRARCRGAGTRDVVSVWQRSASIGASSQKKRNKDGCARMNATRDCRTMETWSP